MKRQNKLIVILGVFFGTLLLAGCEKYTDITPKGRNLLNKVSDLDMLLNQNYSTIFQYSNLEYVVGDMYPFESVPNILNGTQRTLNYAMFSYDRTVDRAGLTLSDGTYTNLYQLITRVSNIVLLNADQAQGSRQLAEQLKAEAYVLRAYAHYLLVNFYAKAYDPASASTDGGIPYVTELNFENVNQKQTVAAVYENLLRDINTALDMNVLPDMGKNNMRMGKAFALAVKARILMSMRNYPQALIAADASLSIKNTLEDYRIYLPVSAGGTNATFERRGINGVNDLFYANAMPTAPFTNVATPEALAQYESGSIFREIPNLFDGFYGNLYTQIPGAAMFYPLTTTYVANGCGMTTTDTFLIKAECQIRSGAISSAMDIINNIRMRRLKNYSPVSTTNVTDAMGILQKLARTEYLFSYRNFLEIKRWNREGTYSVLIQKTVAGKTYTLTNDSPLWVFPFPSNATEFNPTLTQNY